MSCQEYSAKFEVVTLDGKLQIRHVESGDLLPTTCVYYEHDAKSFGQIKVTIPVSMMKECEGADTSVNTVNRVSSPAFRL